MDINELIPWLFGAGWVVFGLIIVFCTTIPMLLVFGGVGYYLYRNSQKAKIMRSESRHWQRTKGIVVKSRVEVSGGETATVSPKVVYEYDVGGRRYQSDQVKAGDRYFSIRTSRNAYDVIDRYPVGAQVDVYYDPDDPSQAALER